MKQWRKIASIGLTVATIFFFTGFPLNSQAGDRGPLKEVVFVHYKLPPEFDVDHTKPPKPGRPVAQCTVTQDDQVNTWDATGWHMPADGLTYKINFNTLPDTISSGDFQDALGSATATWEQADSGLDWTYGGSTSARRARYDGVNLVFFGGASGAIAVTRTWYWVNTGEVAESDITFASNLAWSITSPSSEDCGGVAGTYDVQNIATHELGHQIGLDDLYAQADKDLTMYGYGTTSELKKDSLGTGDVNGAQAVTP